MDSSWLLVGNASRMAADVNVSLSGAVEGVDVVTKQDVFHGG